MLKAVAGKNIILGLSDDNIEKIKAGRPISFNLKDIGLEDRNVLIFYGKTELDMYKELRDKGLIHPYYTIMKDSNAKNN